MAPAKDPYSILGVKKTDSENTIRSAYRKLAKKHHPDLNPNKPESAERFKEIASAYDVLSDPDKRAKFDRGEIDGLGQETPRARPSYGGPSDNFRGGQRHYSPPPGPGTDFDPANLEDLIARAMGQGTGRQGRRTSMRGYDAQYSLAVDFMEAAAGAVRRITLPDGSTLDVTIPAGLRDGAVLRLKGKGEPGLGDGPPGDALIEVSVTPHAYFRREGDDVVLTLPVTLKEAVIGAVLEVPTIKGRVRLTIPPGSGNGSRLRLRGRGIGTGDQFVELQVVVPPGEEPELAELLKTWTPRKTFDPRADLEG